MEKLLKEYSVWKKCASEFDEIKPFVGLSNILDKELRGRKPTKRTHREVIGAAIVDSKLTFKVL